MKDTRIWVCPALCGCELEITAEWVKEAEEVDGRRLSYQHPKGGSIETISIAKVCAQHERHKSEPLPPDPYFGSTGYIPLKGQQIQRRVSVKELDPAQASEAEKLYIQLYRYSGSSFKPDTCGCRIYTCHDRSGKDQPKQIRHAARTAHCRHHARDDNHKAALEENSRKNLTLMQLREKYPEMDDPRYEPKWRFDDQRVLRISLPKMPAGVRRQIVLDVDPSKVVIEQD